MNNLPKVWLAHSYTFNNNYYPGFTREEFDRKIEQVKILQSDLDKHLNFILEKIVYYSGFTWQRQEIPIYICFDRKRRSIAFPLVIAWKSYPGDRLLVLTHELLHSLFRDDRDNIFDLTVSLITPLKKEEEEAVIWLIVKQIFTDLDQAKNTKFMEEYNRFTQCNETQKEYFKTVEEFGKRWNPQEKPLKDWLKTL